MQNTFVRPWVNHATGPSPCESFFCHYLDQILRGKNPRVRDNPIALTDTQGSVPLSEEWMKEVSNPYKITTESLIESHWIDTPAGRIPLMKAIAMLWDFGYRVRPEDALNETLLESEILKRWPKGEWQFAQHSYVLSLPLDDRGLLSFYSHLGDEILNGWLKKGLNLQELRAKFIHYCRVCEANWDDDKHQFPDGKVETLQYEISQRHWLRALRPLQFYSAVSLAGRTGQPAVKTIREAIELLSHLDSDQLDDLLRRCCSDLQKLILNAPRVPPGETILLWRGVGKHYHDARSQGIVKFNGFTSCSLDPTIATRFAWKAFNDNKAKKPIAALTQQQEELFQSLPRTGFLLMVFSITSNQPCLYMRTASQFDEEHEVLLPELTLMRGELVFNRDLFVFAHVPRTAPFHIHLYSSVAPPTSVSSSPQISCSITLPPWRTEGE